MVPCRGVAHFVLEGIPLDLGLVLLLLLPLLRGVGGLWRVVSARSPVQDPALRDEPESSPDGGLAADCCCNLP